MPRHRRRAAVTPWPVILARFRAWDDRRDPTAEAEWHQDPWEASLLLYTALRAAGKNAFLSMPWERGAA